MVFRMLMTLTHTMTTGKPTRNKCNLCPLGKLASGVVLGEGNMASSLMFVGEAPGVEEDRQGRPFVGDAGKLLDRLFDKLGLTRGDIYITNTCKCRPPGNRTPTEEEIRSCLPFLKDEITTVDPAVIVPLGKTALQGLGFLYSFSVPFSLTSVIGSTIRADSRYVVPAFHPAFLLRRQDVKYKYMMFEAVQKAFKMSEILREQRLLEVLEIFGGSVVNVMLNKDKTSS